jgi:predicted  nucleic acid-binding Zn-ribbon protein
VITQELVEAIETLAAIDAELSDLSSELERETETLSARKQQLQALEEKLIHDRESLAEMDRLRADLTQELRQMSLQVDKSREKLSRCRTEREANAVQRELEELRKLYKDREHEIERLSTLGDQARAEIEVADAQREELVGQLGASEGQVTDRLSEVEQRVRAKRAAREQAVKKVTSLDMRLYRRYELVRKRKGSAVAVTSNGSCSACHVRMPPQLFQKLMRREEFGQCPSCHRIIYFREAVDESATDDRSADSPAAGS